jgi:phenylacetate-CoA ligase
MSLYSKIILNTLLLFKKNNKLEVLKELNNNLKIDYITMKDLQFKQIVNVLKDAYENVPFYKYWFDLHKVDIKEINNWDAFEEKIPILTKKDIISHIDKFEHKTIKKFGIRTTGGSTGTPLKYKFSLKDKIYAEAIYLRGLSFGGYHIGNKIVYFGGGSLISNQKKKWSTKLYEKIFGLYVYSSYGITDDDLKKILNTIQTKHIKFIRGYVSSIFLLADYALKHHINIQLKSAFVTSEMLFENQRKRIQLAFNCDVYDNYSLYDGGVSAYEMKNIGRVIDMERAYMEIDKSEGTEGRILATQFYNNVFPFIRYDTGDIGEISLEYTENYPYRPILKKLLGRQTEYLLLNNKKIGSPVLTILMGRTKAEQYKIVQKNEDLVELYIKKSESWSEIDEKNIKESLFDKCGKFKLKIIYVEVFVNENKHKIITREWNPESINN